MSLTFVLLISLLHCGRTAQDLKDNCANLAGSWTGEYKYAISGFCGFCFASGTQLIFKDIDGTGSLFIAHRPGNAECLCEVSNCDCEFDAHNYTAYCYDSHVTMEGYTGLVGAKKILLQDRDFQYYLNKN